MKSCIPKAAKPVLPNFQFVRLTSKSALFEEKNLVNLVHTVPGRRFGLIYKYRQIIITVLSTQ